MVGVATASAGWFDDPVSDTALQERWWNGREWTRHVVPKHRSVHEAVAYTGDRLDAAGAEEYGYVLREKRIVGRELIESGGAIETITPLPSDGAMGALMLRAYNVEFELLASELRPDRLNRALHALEVARVSIDELGAAHGLAIAPVFHRVRCDELVLAAHLEGWSGG